MQRSRAFASAAASDEEAALFEDGWQFLRDRVPESTEEQRRKRATEGRTLVPMQGMTVLESDVVQRQLTDFDVEGELASAIEADVLQYAGGARLG